MDIQGWLLGTTDRAPPDPSDGLAIEAPTFLQPASVEQRYHRKRQRATSDSSILAPQRLSNDRSKKDQAGRDVGRTGNHRHVNLPVVSRPDSANLHGRSLSTAEANVVADRDKQALAKPYEKRARHKTKADRYESKGRKGGEKRELGDNRKSGRKCDRPRRGGDGKRTEPLIQGFKLRNGPKNSRLTLKQDVSAGVFKHGRASAQVQGRNAGLPDLVFNELRFLQNSKQHQNEQHATRNESTQHNEKPGNDREEISAYFSKHKRHKSPNGSLTATRKAADRVGLPDGNAFHGHSEAGNAGSSPLLPDKELPAVPYLGFGSKGTVQQNSHESKPSSSTSCLTWSESGGVLSVQRRSKIQLEKALEAGQLSMQRQRNSERPTGHQQTEHTGHAQRVADAPKHTAKRQGDKLPRRQMKRQHSLPNEGLPVLDEPEAIVSMRDAQLDGATSHSLPVATPNAVEERAQADGEIPTSSSDLKSFDTADILNIKQRLTTLAQQSPPNNSNDCRLPNDKENMHPPSTSPTAKVLRSAREALMRNDQDTFTKPPTMMIDQSNNLNPDFLEMPSHLMTSHQGNSLVQRMPGINEDGTTDRPGVSSWLPTDCHLDHRYMAERQNAQDLDHPPLQETLVTYHQGAYLDGGASETFRRPKRMCTPAMHNEQPDNYSPSTHARDMLWSRSGISSRKTAYNNPFAAHDAHLGDAVVADPTFEDGLGGFWRPHRLY